VADYYAREGSANSDGTPLFANDCDKSSEREVVELLEAKWGCEIKQFGKLCPIDFYALRDGRLVGVMELKSRTHAANKFPTVFLNVRKWISLVMAQQGLGVPALFVVKFSDQIMYQHISAIDASAVRMGGTKEKVKSHTDVEPVIHVPIDSMILINNRITVKETAS
jgi:hypothetical protein